MIYGGDLADTCSPIRRTRAPVPRRARSASASRSIPGGPWTPPEALLAPGSPAVAGDAYGPGSVLFHVACRDQGTSLCARSDPSRPPDAFLPGCPELGRTFDVGRFYGPNVIDAYTRPDDTGGVDVFWTVSTRNPYGVVFVHTNLRPNRPATQRRPHAARTPAAAR